jgi:hypothetical protein
MLSLYLDEAISVFIRPIDLRGSPYFHWPWLCLSMLFFDSILVDISLKKTCLRYLLNSLSCFRLANAGLGLSRGEGEFSCGQKSRLGKLMAFSSSEEASSVMVWLVSLRRSTFAMVFCEYSLGFTAKGSIHFEPTV